MKSLLFVKKCKVCDAQKSFRLKTYDVITKDNKDLVNLDLGDRITVNLMFCQRCGFIYHDYILSPKKIEKLYQLEVRHTSEKDSLQKRVLLERATSFLKRNFDFPKLKKVIDVGAGDFSLIDGLSRSFPSCQFDAINVSFSSDRHGKSRVFRVMLENMAENHSYKLIILSHILEHVADFEPFFKNLEKLTGPKAVLYVEVPFQVGPSLFLTNSYHAQHINYFTPLTLERLLKRFGYRLDTLEFDTEGGYLYYGLPGVIRAKFSPERETTQLKRSPFNSRLFSGFYLLNPYIFVRGRVRSQLRKKTT
jgi:C4-type Zn-finger protein